MEFCGGHTHAISRYGVEDLLPGQRAVGAWPRLPGMCFADRADRRRDPSFPAARRHAVHLRRFDARARLRWQHLAEDQGGGRGYPHGVFDTGRHSHRRDGAGPRGRVLRDRLRDDNAAHRTCPPACAAKAAFEFQRVLQPRADAAGDARHPRHARRIRQARCAWTASWVRPMSAR